MKVFITGAAGFVGSRLAKALMARGNSVVGFDNLNDYYDPPFKQRRLDEISREPRFTFVKGDLLDVAIDPRPDGHHVGRLNRAQRG